MQFEIPEGAHVQIIVGGPASMARGGALPALFDAAPAERPAPRYSRALLKGGLLVMLLAASFATGDYFASRPRAPSVFAGPGSLTGAAAAPPRPAPVGEQHAFPDRALPRDAAAPAPGGQVPAEFQRQLLQPPTVMPPPGQGAGSSALGWGPGQGLTGIGSAPGKNPFGLGN